MENSSTQGVNKLNTKREYLQVLGLFVPLHLGKCYPIRQPYPRKTQIKLLAFHWLLDEIQLSFIAF